MADATVDTARRVLVVSADPRVADALASLLNAAPGLAAQTALGTPCDVEDAVGLLNPDVAVVDVTRSQTARDVRLVRRLARRVPVIAMCDCGTLPDGAVPHGVVCCCDKDGDVDALLAAVLGVTAHRTGR
jgi:DNA-binding NarL/FixJ family response regulator